LYKKFDLKKENTQKSDKDIYEGDAIPIFCYGSNGVE